MQNVELKKLMVKGQRLSSRTVKNVKNIYSYYSLSRYTVEIVQYNRTLPVPQKKEGKEKKGEEEVEEGENMYIKMRLSVFQNGMIIYVKNYRESLK